MVGINSNLAAASATRNLGSANSVVQDSISRLSSGNRIVKASDDVAGLSIGTSIKTQVSSLQVALSNTGQARSVLQIGDGALAQVNDILSRQKALATQANAGSLGSEQLSFLNSEFLELTSEIDRIVSTTAFNGIVLLDGSIAGDAGVNVAAPTATSTNTAAVPATVSVGAPSAYTAQGTIVAGGLAGAPDGLNLGSFDDSTITSGTGFGTITAINFIENGTEAETVQLQTTINGTVYQTGNITAAANGGNIADDTTLTFTAVGGSSAFSVDINGLEAGAIGDSSAADTFASRLTTALAPLELFQTRAADISSNLATTGGDGFDITAATVSIVSNNFDDTNSDFGTIGEISIVAGSDTANSITVTVNDTTFSTSDIGGADNDLQDGDTITLTGRNAGGDATGETITITLTTLEATVDLTSATEVASFEAALNEAFGVVPAGTQSTSAFSTVNAITGSNVTSISVASFDDAAYQAEGFGTFTVAEFTENSSNAENVTFTTTLGDKTYTSSLSASADGGAFSAQTLTFTATDGSGSAFDVGIAASTTIGGIGTQALADTVASNITAGLASVDIYSQRTISSVDVTQVTNTVAEGLTATSASITSNQFDVTNNNFGDIGAFTGTAGSDTSNQLSVQINGITFSATDIGGSDDILSAADGSIQLLGRDAAGNSNGQTFDLDISGLTRTVDLTNQDELNGLTNALNSYFGSGSSGSGGLSFQVGSATTDSISISVASVATTNIYRNDSGDSVTLDISSQENAQIASDVLDNAINTVISRRADIGAGISRFEFAARNIETSIANQDAARGEFLDADIAEESTQFASAQVKLQASISVLAQANGLTQNLLTLVQG